MYLKTAGRTVKMEDSFKIKFILLKILSSQKEGGREGYHSNRFDFLHHRRWFFGILKGLIF
jgi:hypothetical protein